MKKIPKNKETANKAKSFIGKVVSGKPSKTLVILLEYKSRHPLYRKIVKKNKKIYADNNLNAKEGDMVQVAECRPLSKLKRFTTIKIIQKSQ